MREVELLDETENKFAPDIYKINDRAFVVASGGKATLHLIQEEDYKDGI